MRIATLFLLMLLQACTANTQLRLYHGPAIGTEQEVTLELPLSFELLQLDNEPVAQFEQTFRNQALLIKLAPGAHTLVLRYSDVWEIDSENHDKLTSGHITFEGEFKSGQRYRIDAPTLNNYQQAKDFVNNPEVSLKTQGHTLTGVHTQKSDPLRFHTDENVPQVDYPNLKQLKFWWSNANEYERKQFKQWLNESP